MSLTVSSLCRIQELEGVTVVAGHEGLENTVLQVAPLGCRSLWEAAEEKVLTIYDCRPYTALTDVETQLPLNSGRIAAVLTKAAPDEDVPPELIRACRKHKVPLLQLPAGSRWIKVFPPLFAALNPEASPAPVREAFMRVSLAGGGMHGILEFLRWLAEAPAILVSPSQQLLDHSGRTFYGVDLSHCTETASRLIAGEGSGNSQVTGRIEAIQAGNTFIGHLCLVPVEGPLPEATHEALRRAAEMAAWQHVHDSRRRMDWHARTHFLTELLLGRFENAHSARAWASALGVQLAPCYLVIVVALDDYDTRFLNQSAAEKGSLEIMKERMGDIIEDALNSTDVSSLSVGFSDSVAAAIGLPAGIGPRDAAVMARKLAARVRTGISQAFRDISVTVGIGQLVESIAQLPKGYAQARQIAALGRHLRGPGGIHALADLGFFRLLSRMEDRTFLSEFTQDVLGPIDSHDDHGQAPVLPTLEAFLAADGNRLRCAKELYLHPNTVSYRLGLVEKLTGLSPFRSEDRFLLQAALKVRQHLKAAADDGLPAPLRIAAHNGTLRVRNEFPTRATRAR